MNREINNWLATADYDVKTAIKMFETGRYVYVVFMCHLAIEKAFKAVVTQEIKQAPPKTHDLIKLVELGKIKLSEELLDFVGMINNVSVVTRYPEDLKRLIAGYPKRVSKEYLSKTREIIKWIKTELKSSK